MRDFGSKLADYEALADEPVMDLNSLESERTQFLRQAETEVNNDAEVDENDDDAVRCIPKVMQVSFSTVFENTEKVSFYNFTSEASSVYNLIIIGGISIRL